MRRPTSISAASGLRASLLLGVIALAAGAARGQDPADLEFFESRIRPIFVERCESCHSAGAGQRKSDLTLDAREGWVRGGERGPALVPGDPAASLLLRAVRREDGAPAMPPTKPLDARRIADLEEWIRRGAPDPRVLGPARPHDTVDPAAAGAHWAYQPVADPEPPALRDASRVRSPIDRFVFARLETEGLRAAPDADRPTLIRRATQELTGLPATEAEIAAFVADEAPGAFERVVDRLLASPRYGEKQARAWLDLARYADSNGLDENLAHAHAWRYRDWVVRAMNEDLPYDRFVALQIAGDLLEEEGETEAVRNDRLVATGFLSLGPKMLAEQDKVKLALDVVDEQMDVACRAVIATTMGCARCHDHKFDPVTARDYYAMAGIFRSTSTLSELSFVSRWREHEVATEDDRAARMAWQADLAAATSEHRERRAAVLRAATASWRPRVADHARAAFAAAARVAIIEAEAASRGNLHADDAQWGSPDAVVTHTTEPGRQYLEFDLDVPVTGDYRLELRYAAKEARPMRWAIDGRAGEGEVAGATTGGWMPDDQRWDEGIPLRLEAGRRVLRLERDGAVPHLDKIALRPVEMPWSSADLRPEVVRAWTDFLVTRSRSSAESFPAAVAEGLAAVGTRLGAEPLAPALVDEEAERLAALDARVVAGEPASAAELDLHGRLFAPRGPMGLPPELGEESLPPAERAELAALARRIKELERNPVTLPAAMGVADATPVDLPVHLRGDPLTLGPAPVPRGMPAFLESRLPAPSIPEGVSGRRELAAWLVDPRHPLTARVMANRIWLAHFGEGLVDTPSNFGLNGSRPTHPELLDWLARRLVASGWSRKALHREILLSTAWRLAADPVDATARERDPEARLISHRRRRRLDAEGVRDAILFVSGALDLKAGGTLLATPDRDYVTNDQSRDAASYQAPRRSLYLPIIRNAVYDLFSTFDYNDPSAPMARRGTTVIPHQPCSS
ncbi:MAG: DUF1549 domain-containing protein [Planctomycetota bacterium]